MFGTTVIGETDKIKKLYNGGAIQESSSENTGLIEKIQTTDVAVIKNTFNILVEAGMVTRNDADEQIKNAETGNRAAVYDFLVKKDLMDEFLKFMGQEIQRMMGLVGDAIAGGDAPAVIGIQQQIFLDQLMNKLAEMVQEREKKAGDKD